MIIPAIAALAAGNFAGQQRPAAYGLAPARAIATRCRRWLAALP